MKDDMKIEMEAGRNIQLDHIKEIMKENIPALIQQNQNLQSELDKTIKQLKDYEKALKEYADGDFYEADVNLQTNPLTNENEVFSVDITDNKKI